MVPSTPMQVNNPDVEHLSDDEDDSFRLLGRLLPQQTSSWWRRRTCLFLILPVILLLCLPYFAYQSSSQRFGDSQHRSACADNLDDCRTNAPFVFDSVNSLLKQWPNTYSPNGHSIVAGTVPPNTQLYHARPDGKSPKVPTFFALDAEMSLGIYAGSGTPLLYTMATTRALKVLHFDGQSAALTYWGTLDSQMVLLQNGIQDNPSESLIFNEDQRAVDLCRLIKDMNVDGIARMNAGFEVLLCDYASVGVELLFSSNVTVPGADKREADPKLPKDPNRTPPLGFGNDFAPQNSWEWIRSSTWHYGVSANDASSSKETRIELDLCGFMTYYDPFLRSLSESSHQNSPDDSGVYQNGWGYRKGHRLKGISGQDIDTVKKWIKQIPDISASPRRQCSGTNWQALTETIINQHQTRAREISATMRDAGQDPEKLQTAVIKVHELSHAVLYAYLQYPSTAKITPVEAKSMTISRCSTIYTHHIDSKTLNDFEVIIKESIALVVATLCEWEWSIFEMSERYTTNQLDPLHELLPDSGDDGDLARDFRQHADTTEELISWLGWDTWHDCGRKCKFDELCYIPMWPVIYAPGKHQGGFYADDSYTEREMYEFWKPTCLNRRMFDRYGGRAREPSHQLPDPPGVLKQ